jgi:hypothetical protein
MKNEPAFPVNEILVNRTCILCKFSPWGLMDNVCSLGETKIIISVNSLPDKCPLKTSDYLVRLERDK